MRRLLPVLLLLAGCDQVFGLSGDDTVIPDGHRPDDGAIIGDAPPDHPCARRSPTPVFCADFDEPLPVVYRATESFPLPPPRVAPSANWQISDPKEVSHLKAALAIQGASVPTAAAWSSTSTNRPGRSRAR